MVLSSFLFAVLVFYAGLLIFFAYGYLKTPVYRSTPYQSDLSVSIIICARNEAKRLPLCLKSLLAQNFNKQDLQLIVVNDASSDETKNIAQSILEASGLEFLILSNNRQLGKKASITKAIAHARHHLILTRDADTFTLSQTWLQEMMQFKREGNYDLIIGPVNIANSKGLLWALQCIENRVLSILTAGSAYFKKPLFCSGANLLFTKTIFEKANGYESHSTIASGDDVLFMEDVKKIKGTRIAFLKSKEALVYTYPQFQLPGLLHQKVRWAQKYKHNPNTLNLLLSLLTFSVNALWIFAFIAYFLFPPHHTYFLVFVIIKLLPELFLLFLSRRFMSNKHLFWYALAVALVYPFYAVGIAFLSLFLQPKWK
jgi:poly-beta-1,6-N-acetyl-D-glucosamine synthase